MSKVLIPDTFLISIFNLFCNLLATKNFQDWWLSYWVEQTAFYGGRLSEVFYGGSLSEAFYGGSVSEDDSYYLSIYGYLLIASFVSS